MGLIIVAIVSATLLLLYSGREIRVSKTVEANIADASLYTSDGDELDVHFGYLDREHNQRHEVKQILKDGGEISLRLIDTTDTTLGKKNYDGIDIIRFENVFQSTDVFYEITDTRTKELIVLRDESAPKIYRYLLTISKDLVLDRSQDNGIIFKKDNDVVQGIPPLFAVDAKGDISYEVNLNVADAEDPGVLGVETSDEYKYYILGVKLSNTWLESASYPIVVDPSIVHDTSVEFADGEFINVIDVGSGSSPLLQIGYEELSLDTHTNALWHFDEGNENTCSGGEDVCDSSGNDNDGTFAGNTVFDSDYSSNFVRVGSNSVSYDGNLDYITVPNQEYFHGDNSFSVEYWTRPGNENELEYDRVLPS